jgi:hypothetical protein
MALANAGRIRLETFTAALMLEIARENTAAFFDFAQKVATTREPNAMIELFTAHMQKQMEMFSKQSQELTALGQKLASKGTGTSSGAFRS